jgi:hypothetical protein
MGHGKMKREIKEFAGSVKLDALKMQHHVFLECGAFEDLRRPIFAEYGHDMNFNLLMSNRSKVNIFAKFAFEIWSRTDKMMLHHHKCR